VKLALGDRGFLVRFFKASTSLTAARARNDAMKSFMVESEFHLM
jgi:hypothetical protein